MYSRIKKLVHSLSSKKIDAFLVTDDVNISYLTERVCSEAWLLVTPKKTFYITDARYYLKAKQDLRGIKAVLIKDSIYKATEAIIMAQKSKSVGFNGKKISFYQYKELKKTLIKNINLVNTNNIIEQLRAQKDNKEIAEVRDVLSIHGQVYDFLKKIIVPGKTERQVFRELDIFVRSQSVKFSFDTIIASGPNSCYPHAQITDRKIRKNDVVLVDMGIDKFGYKSDLTRMFFLGKITKLIQEVNAFVKESQVEAIKMIGPGIKASEIDKQARNYLSKKRLAKYFSHALGHGVGLEIHELPVLSGKNTSLLKEGMIVTVEPGVYIPNKFGIRIEDMVLITKKGCEVLSDNIN